MSTLAEPMGLDARVAAAARGDRQAYERLVHDHRRLVATISLAIVGEVAASEDVAQEVFIAAWRGLPSLRNPASFLPWLRQMTRNRAHKQLEARRRRREARARDESTDATIAAAVDPRPGADARLVGEEEEAALRQALDALPDESREVLTLFYREGQSVRQVADLLGIAEDAVKKRLSRARARLREDVIDRFALAAERTAPGEGFTRAVLAALPTGSTGLGGAATWKLASVLGKGLALFSGAILGGLGAFAGIFFGTRAALRRAQDEQERRGLRHQAVVGVLLCVVVATTNPFLRGWQALAEGVAFAISVNMSALVWRHKIIARRLAAERALDPSAAERQRKEARWSTLGMTVGTAIALGAFVWNFFHH